MNNTTSHSHAHQHQHDTNNHYKVTFGRGGAGNIITSHSKPKPKLIKQGSQTPSIIQPVYSTGRGGAGNLKRNIDPKLTRRAQDVDDTDAESDIIIIKSNDSRAVSEATFKEGDDEEDFIDNEHILDELHQENEIQAVLSNMKSRLSALSGNANDHDVTIIPKLIPKATVNKADSNKLKRVKTLEKVSPPIVIGRGGAGNIISPKSSGNKQDKKSKSKTKSGKKEKGPWSSFLNIFS